MQINPFNLKLVTLEADAGKVAARVTALSQDLEWYRGFSAKKLRETHTQLAENVRGYTELRDRMAIDLQKLDRQKKDASALVALRLDPRSWLSSERAVAKRHIETLDSEIAALKGVIDDYEAKLNSFAEVARKLPPLSDALERYRNFDEAQVGTEYADAQSELEQLRAQLDQLRKRKLALDAQLAQPWQSLEAARYRCRDIERKMQRADQFAAELDNARSTYERAQTHQACQNELGDRSPNKVRKDLKRALDSEARTIAKLEERIANIVRKAEIDIRKIVIDGNNLMYQGKKEWIGLAALEELVPELAKYYKVTVVFDPGVTRRLKLSTRAIASRLPQASINVATRGTKADDLLLNAVDGDPYAYVLSADNFVDYPEHEAIRKRRLLKPTFINGTCTVSDLDISVRFVPHGEVSDSK